MVPTVAVLGGGVAGLSAAHELTIRGFDVTVYEARERFGGKARSYPVRVGDTDQSEMPGEHGFRFFPGFYWHIVDTMDRIPDGDGTVADNLVPTEETLVTNVLGTEITEGTRTPTTLSEWKDVVAPPRLTGLPRSEALFFAERMLEIATSCRERRENELEETAWWEFVEAERMSSTYQQHVARSTQSFVALDPRRASARTMGEISLQLIRGRLDPDLVGERVLNGPTSETWIEPWVAHLEDQGVTFRPGVSVREFHVSDDRISGVTAEHAGESERLTADYYVAALPVQVLRRLADDALLEAAPSLSGLDALATDWMVGIQFYLSEDVPLSTGHQNYTGSEWALTSISQQQFWDALAWYHRVIEQDLAGVFILQDREFVYVNERLAELLGYMQSDLLGESPGRIADSPTDETSITELSTDIVDTQESCFRQFTASCADGTGLPVEVRAGPIRYDNEPACVGVLWPTR
jgi:PAS domain S-box-containing protein